MKDDLERKKGVVIALADKLEPKRTKLKQITIQCKNLLAVQSKILLTVRCKKLITLHCKKVLDVCTPRVQVAWLKY